MIRTRLLAAARLVLAVATIGAAALVCSGAGGAGGAAATATSGGFTPLPGGWELCILQGVTAPLTLANVANLDEWQAEEGGSTNNTAAYNPFNTLRATTATGAVLPAATSANGFPAFADWLSGCAATVATLLQPNMWSITAALRTGAVTPPPAFLAAVDQSQWCAPSNGVPCYADAILGAAGSLATGMLTASSALEVYGNVNTDVQDYQQSVTATMSDQVVLTTREQQLTAAQAAVTSDQDAFEAAQHVLQSVAVDEYVSNGLYTDGTFADPHNQPAPFRSLNADGVIAGQYEGIVAGDLVARFQSAESAVKASLTHRDDATKAVTQATATLDADQATEKRTLTRLVADLATMQRAGACTTVSITTPSPGTPASATPGNGSTTGSTTTTTTAPAPVSTTTVPTGVATITVPSTTTTTTTVPSSTTTTAAAPLVPAGGAPTSSTSTTTSTSTSTSTTTTSVPTTTTTTPARAVPGGSAAAPAATANPAGLAALQGCITALAPPPGQ